jgi:hypothetical protein
MGRELRIVLLLLLASGVVADVAWGEERPHAGLPREVYVGDGTALEEGLQVVLNWNL